MARFLGVDIGGTNTDLICVDTTRRVIHIAKVPTTATDQALGMLGGIDELGTTPGGIDLIVHGTTVATNAIIERKGARCGLICTQGFRDVLELRRRDRPRTYGLSDSFEPLVSRDLRLEVVERMSAQGKPLAALDEVALRAATHALLAKGCEVVVVCFLHSYANPVHEHAAGRVLREAWPNDYVVLSSDILPTVREFERTSTAVLNGYVEPLVDRYFRSLADKLATGGYGRDLLVVQSNGGVMGAGNAARFAANTILSGPAAGVTAAAQIASELGLSHAVSADMGGTSLDVCIIRDGVAGLNQQTMLEFGMPLGLPMLDVTAIGAGGGSLARLDTAGLLQIGPESAGSDPGPACYGRGGTVPTVTDACVVVGLLDPGSAIGKGRGGDMSGDLARAAIQRAVAEPLGFKPEEAAEAILTVAGVKMAGHIRRRLLERGQDPREFSVIAFGGGGPLHANRILREAELKSAIIPYYPGLTSAFGCILGKLRHDFLRTANASLTAFDEAKVERLFAEQEAEGRRLLEQEGADEAAVAVLRFGEMRYAGQSHLIPVELPAGKLDADSLRRAFEVAYQARYANLLQGVDVVLADVRTSVVASAQVPTLGELVMLPDGPVPKPERGQVFFGGSHLDVAVYQRRMLPAGTILLGPALLLQPDTTTFIEPLYQGRVHRSGNLIIEAVA